VSAVLQVLLFPGLLFTAMAGLLTSWVDRKVTARVQMRVGPPLLQPFYDIGKLCIKETCVPVGGETWLFLGAPLLGLAGAALASTILWRTFLDPAATFVGDLVAVLYLLTLPAVSVVLGAFASRNPLASLGGSREMKLILAYELPLVLAACVSILQAGSLRLGTIMTAPPAGPVSGLLALAVAVLCMQAKLTLVPFDVPEAETELSGGAYIEYSGPPLAMFKITRAMMLFTMPVFLVALFGGGIPLTAGPLPVLGGLLKVLGLVVLMILIRNTAPRLRTDQAIRFFWGPATLAAAAAVLLASIGW
jgi:NADH-quinone oxidoreductase subunit H